YLYSFVTWIGDIDFVGFGIDCHRRVIVKLPVAISLGAPGCENCSIGTELDDSSASLIDNIDRIIGANGNPSWPVESRIRAFPLVNESSIGRKLLNTVIGGVSYIDIASLVHSETVRSA